MAITKYTLRNPAYSTWRDLEEVSNRLSRFFDDAPAQDRAGAWAPLVNVSETKEGLVLTAEIPGMPEDGISIELENNVLTISGEKIEERKEGDDERRCHLWERRYGTFSRSFTLPRTIKSEDITAGFEYGILTVHLPKAPEAKGRKIEIAKG
ncbi:MAG: Hsp20/alpha crystallin family protein [Gemmatimonadetes bacterium]|mgnify:CR=1 FL=1|jgi:HSP20 family protein|nr:Hsp20/alpha crystallin family protein [Gemmatimonadota bacterium]